METNDIQSSSCITLWRQVTPDMLAVAELRQICAMRGSGKKRRGGSLCVTFSHHYAVLFRVPTWGLVFSDWNFWHKFNVSTLQALVLPLVFRKKAACKENLNPFVISKST